MMGTFKYIRFESSGFILFTGVVMHSTIKAQIKDYVISAGFVSFNKDGKPNCYGHSQSLNLTALPEDSDCLAKWMERTQ